MRHIEGQRVQLLPHLTKREQEVLLLTASGMTEKEIAGKLATSPNTIRIHIENSKRKLICRNKVDLVVTALRLRLIDFPQIGTCLLTRRTNM
jgi:DNA-binding CsgD family transcriptional regulator